MHSSYNTVTDRLHARILHVLCKQSNADLWTKLAADVFLHSVDLYNCDNCIISKILLEVTMVEA